MDEHGVPSPVDLHAAGMFLNVLQKTSMAEYGQLENVFGTKILRLHFTRPLFKFTIQQTWYP